MTERPRVRKRSLAADTATLGRAADEIDIACCATIAYSSEDPAHPVENILDGQSGPGGTRWVSARPDTAEHIVVEFEQPRSLPELRSPLEAFRMALPPHTEISLCRDSWAVDELRVSSQAYVEIGGVKLTGFVSFDCGLFRQGSLFEDTRINGETWARGRAVFRKDLGLPPASSAP
jgi:hypothetical protein